MKTRLVHAVLLLTTAFFVSAPPGQAADDAVVQLRVLGPAGPLEFGTSYVTNTEKIKTDRKAKCFVGGGGGTGTTVKLPGPTATGLLQTASGYNANLDPLSVTDEFGFGLGLCGIGDVKAGENDFWNLVVNHQAAQVGGDQLRVRNGDEVFWHLSQYPPDPELELEAAPGTAPGLLEVTVFAWSCSTEFPAPTPPCVRTPAEGAVVAGGDSPAVTDAGGKAFVPLSTGPRTLVATKNDHWQSAPVRVCVSSLADECPEPTDPPSTTIIGRAQGDDFAARGGWDSIRARGGADIVDIRRGGSDRVNCGAGKDIVRVSRGDLDDQIGKSCEKVRRD